MDDYIIDGDLAFSNSRDALKFYQEQYYKKKEWVGLMDEEIFGMFGTYVGDPDYNHNKLLIDARRIEAKLKDKNT